MSWRDALGLVVRELRRRAGRSALTVAAVALAATLLTALVTIASTAQDRVLSEVTTGGPLAGIKVVAAAPDPSQVGQDDAAPGPPKALDDSGVARIRSLKDVAAVYPILSVPVIVVTPERIAVPGGPPATPGGPPAVAGGAPAPPATAATTVTTPSTTTFAPGTPGVGPDAPFGDTIVGVPLTKSGQLPVTLVAGRLPTPGSLSEVAVTTEFLNRLHIPVNEAGAVVGTSVEVGFPRAFGRGFSRARWLHPVVVGVADQDAGSGDLVGSIELATVGRNWIEAGGPAGAAEFGLQPTTYTGLFVIADRLDRVSTVRTAITAVGYSTSAPENLIASVRRYLRVVEIVLAGVGAIALVVAALGIANALFAAVRERRQEIGVLKAIGARDRDVLRVFMIEALAVGTLGGLIGAALGTMTAAGVGAAVNRYLTEQGVAGIRLVVSVPLLALAVAGSGVLAVLAGLPPALRAARLRARGHRRMTRTIAPVMIAAALAVAGCSTHGATPTTRVGGGGPPIVYAAIGGSETVGEGTDNPVRDAWPQVFFRTALPASATFVNFAIPGVTVSTALNGELPEVLDVRPNLVTVWSDATDLLNGVPPLTYESQLRSLLAQLRTTGATVLVANAPPVTDLPVYAACRRAGVDPDECPPGVAQPVPAPAAFDALIDSYNAATARVAKAEGAVLVDLHAADLRAQAAGHAADLVGHDGLDPSADGAVLVAGQFAAALRSAGPLPPLRS